MRQLIGSWCLVPFLLLGISGEESLAADDPRPNVLLVLFDDLGFSDLGCYGGEIPTPHIDRLAAGGARMAQFYNSARCCPSRASLMTGLHPHQAGIGSFATASPDHERGPAYLGHLNDRCEKSDELDNTLILLLSDNGACYEWGPFGFDGDSRKGITHLHQGEELKGMGGPGTHHAYGSAWANLCNTPFQLYKHFTHEGGICSPMIAHWPAAISHREDWIREPGHIMDIMPTLCEATGARYPSELQGREIQPVEGVSLLPALRGERLPERPLAFEHQEARALRKGRWKVVWSKRMPHEVEWELYDMENDRCETEDLAKTYPELTGALAEEWIAWAKRVKVYPFFAPEN